MLVKSYFKGLLWMLFILVNLCFSASLFAQTFVFAEINSGNNFNLNGWNLTGNAQAADTPGDADAIPDEILLTNNGSFESGGVFFQTAINPLICSKWTVEYDYRIWGGSAADGLAFCFLDVPPAGFVSGGGVGIPGTSNGLKVVFDTFNNCGAPNPEMQIYYGQGYNECAAGIVKIDNSSGNLNFIRNSNYQRVRITYLNGVVTVFVNNTQYLSANFPITFIGYMGFTSSTGGSNDQHSIKNVIIYTDQAQSNAGPDVGYCTGGSVQIGTSNNADFVYSWSPSNGLSANNVSNPTVNLVNNGNTTITQTYTVTTSLGANPGVCPTTDQVTVSVFPQFVRTVFDTVCNGGPYSFHGQSITSSGTYTANLQTVNGCDSIVNLNLIISTSPVLPNLNTTVCQGASVQLTPSGAVNYSWSPAPGNVSANGTLTFVANQTQSLNLTGWNQFNCTSTQTVVVTVQPKPNVSIQASLNGVCPGQTSNLVASGASTYLWLNSGFSDPTLSSQFVSPSTNTTYRVVGENAGGCSDTAQIIVQAFQSPNLDISPSQSICLGQAATIFVSGANQYVWSPIGSGNSFVVSPQQTTTYTIVGVSSDGCSDTVTSLVNVFPIPSAAFSLSSLLLSADNPVVTVTNNSMGGVAYQWNFGDGTVSSESEPVFDHVFPQSENGYQITLRVTNEVGCIAIASQNIQVKGDEIYYVPNSFTPDGDEFNNVFTPIFTSGFDPQNFTMYVYNRWGHIIFETRDHQIGWDGYFFGRRVQAGIYTYIIRFKAKNTDEYKVISGHVNLLK
jgi:gliding motility-associated-like protein